MATRKSVASTNGFSTPTAKAKGGQGRPSDQKVAGWITAGLATNPQGFSYPVSSVKRNGTVTEVAIDHNGATVTLTYSKVKGAVERMGHKLASKGNGFYLSPDQTMVNVNLG